ncbi:hypothetical protein EUV02_04740 [Polymorphobacter arshaanensis]|uniref:Lipocalin-like domain-containing protein n=1 Tax=Glacieibacterium arshaanense TaxID=2511025 RepID=A0A4Y9ERP5_9SPHN|nr:hypothetical protein [Polymorphobacter arshaanensis]TFU06307.1 hypothetical protein EUV02_04740 [Polymorphobacter arshaanensis]
MRRLAGTLLLLTVSACQTTGSVAPSHAPPLSPLIGTWGLETDQCQGDNALAFDSNGKWSAYRTGGSWRLYGMTLTIITTSVENDNGQTITVASPQEQREQISFPVNDRLVMVAKDGKTTRLKRCR